MERNEYINVVVQTERMFFRTRSIIKVLLCCIGGKNDGKVDVPKSEIIMNKKQRRDET